jgi:hypothetical protein
LSRDVVSGRPDGTPRLLAFTQQPRWVEYAAAHGFLHDVEGLIDGKPVDKNP